MGQALRKQTFSPLYVLKEGDSPFPSTERMLRIIDASKKGVSSVQLKNLLTEIGLNMKELSEILPVSYSSLSKKKSFSPEVSERIYALSILYRMGMDVFNDRSIFTSWLRKPNQALGGAIPFELLGSNLGMDIVRDELLRIEHGLFV